MGEGNNNKSAAVKAAIVSLKAKGEPFTQQQIADRATEIFGAPISLALVRKVVQDRNATTGEKRGRGRPPKSAATAPTPVPRPANPTEAPKAIVPSIFRSREAAAIERASELLGWLCANVESLVGDSTPHQLISNAHAAFDELSEIFAI